MVAVGWLKKTSLSLLLSLLSPMPGSSDLLSDKELANLLSGCKIPKEILIDKGANEQLLTFLLRGSPEPATELLV